MKSCEFKGFDDWIPIFAGGKQRDSMGREHDGNALIDKAVANFNATKHEPPAVIGHPADNAPAFGWVEGLKKEGRLLLAKFKQVQPDFADMIKQGLFKKRSAAFYPDGSLRHVGFLGAAPPAIKGLPDVAFSEKGSAVFEFSEVPAWTWDSVAGIFRKLREWIIEKDGQETADRIIPDWNIEDIKAAAKTSGDEPAQLINTYKEKEDKNMSFKEKLIAFFTELIGKMPDDGPAGQGSGVRDQGSGGQFTEADIETARKQAADEAAKKEREKVTAEFAEQGRLARSEARRKEVSSWCDTQVAAGKMTPAMVKYGIPEMLSAFAEKEDVLEFGEAKDKATLFDRFKGLFETELPKLVEFKEIATRDKDAGGKGKRDQLIAQFMEQNKEASYKEGVLAVSKEHPELFREEE